MTWELSAISHVRNGYVPSQLVTEVPEANLASIINLTLSFPRQLIPDYCVYEPCTGSIGTITLNKSVKIFARLNDIYRS